MNNMINNIMDNTINNSLDKLLENNEKCLINNIKQYLKCDICNNINCDEIDKYEINYNWKTPFVVYINHFDKNIEIYETITYDKDEEIKRYNFLNKNYKKYYEDNYQVKFLKFIKVYRKYKNYFIGKDLLDKKNNGNTILIQRDNNKLSIIGSMIYDFHLKENEKIIDFHSIIKGVESHPYIITNKNIYLTHDCKYISLTDLNKEYYSNDITNDKRLYKKLFYRGYIKRYLKGFKISMFKRCM
jgi:hypothetical protein